MFFLKKLITSLILPPGIFIAVLVCCGLYQIIRRRKIGYIILICGLSLYAFSIGPTKDVLLAPLENEFPLDPNVNGDVIVVLGGGINGDASRLKSRGFSSAEGFSRLVCAYRLWKRLRVKIFYTGNLGSKVAIKFLTVLGVPEGDVIMDDQALDTFGNSLHAKQFLEASGFKAPILVTSAFHMKRALYAFNQQNIQVVPYPCGYRSKEKYDVYSILPAADNLANAAIALKEYLGLVVYEFDFH